MSNYLLEIACFNVASAIIAHEAGAHRIELCENYSIGGITPSKENIKQVIDQVSIPVFVMIRPRAGDFFYNDQEFEIMKHEVEWCKQNNIAGVVFGILTKEQKIDEQRCKILVQLAQPMSCTFHRAFDEVDNIQEGLESVIRSGFQRILTSGKKTTAIESLNTISQLIQQAQKRIIILPGGGIRPDNIAIIKEKTAASEFHSAALSKQETADKNIILKMLTALT